MNIFQPYEDVADCAQALDDRRLIKQILECKQIYDSGIQKRGYSNHPVTQHFKLYRFMLFVMHSHAATNIISVLTRSTYMRTSLSTSSMSSCTMRLMRISRLHSSMLSIRSRILCAFAQLRMFLSSFRRSSLTNGRMIVDLLVGQNVMRLTSGFNQTISKHYVNLKVHQ